MLRLRAIIAGLLLFVGGLHVTTGGALLLWLSTAYGDARYEFPDEGIMLSYGNPWWQRAWLLSWFGALGAATIGYYMTLNVEEERRRQAERTKRIREDPYFWER